MKPNINFDQYGGITLIGSKEMIDPRLKSNKVYSADAYTTRYPSVSYKVTNEKPISDIISTLPQKGGFAANIEHEALYQIGQDGDRYLDESKAIQVLFAHSKGGDILEIRKTDIPKDVLDAVRDIKGSSYFSIKDNKEAIEKIRKAIESNLSDKHRRIYERTGLIEDGVVGESLIGDTFEAAKDYIFHEGEVDYFQTRYNAANYIKDNKLESELKQFTRDLYSQLNVEEKLFDGYNRSGNPRYIAHTKENALKVMKKNRGAAKEGMGGAFGQIRAKLAPEFKSIQAIKDKADVVVDNEESKKAYDNAVDKYDNITTQLEEYHAGSKDWLDTKRDFIDEVDNLVRNGESEMFDKIPTELHEEIKTFVNEVANLPSDYFEAKPERAIGLNEFSAAVLPKGTDQRVIDALTDSGVSVHEYTDSDRMEVVKKVSAENDLMFRTVNEENSILSKSKNRGGKHSPTVQTQINWEAEVGNVPARRNKSISSDTAIREVQRKAGYDPTIDNQVTHVERLLTNHGAISFIGAPLTGGAKINGANDVAFLFKNLESAASENVFIVYAKDNGEYNVLYSTTGSSVASIVDVKTIATAAKDFGATKLWMVHSIPSAMSVLQEWVKISISLSGPPPMVYSLLQPAH